MKELMSNFLTITQVCIFGLHVCSAALEWYGHGETESARVKYMAWRLRTGLSELWKAAPPASSVSSLSPVGGLDPRRAKCGTGERGPGEKKCGHARFWPSARVAQPRFGGSPTPHLAHAALARAVLARAVLARVALARAALTRVVHARRARAFRSLR